MEKQCRTFKAHAGQPHCKKLVKEQQKNPCDEDEMSASI